MGYDFEIRYRAGKQNLVADALSRMPNVEQLFPLSTVSFGIIDQLKQENLQDPELLDLQHRLCEDPVSLSDFSLREGLLFFRDRLVSSSTSSLHGKLLKEFHESLIGGHSGITRTFHRLSTNFYWKFMRRDVQTFIRNCQTYQRMKEVSIKPSGLLQPLQILEQVFEDISMDFIIGFPISKGYSIILVVVDILSKYGHFLPFKTPVTSESVAATFITEIMRLYGIPVFIVSDCDPRFLIEFWRELHKWQGTKLSPNIACHP